MNLDGVRIKRLHIARLANAWPGEYPRTALPGDVVLNGAWLLLC